MPDPAARDGRTLVLGSSRGALVTTSASRRAVFLGLALGIDAVGHCVAVASLIFAGPLISGLGVGTALFLISTLVVTLTLARWGGLPGALGIAQDSTIAIVATATASAAIAIDSQGGEPLPTAIAIIGLSTLLSGVAFFVMGHFGLGGVVRTMPYPVALGFLASSGWLLTYAAITMMADTSSAAEILPGVWENVHVILPAAALAICLMLAVRIWHSGGVIVAVLAVSLLGFYLALPILGIDLSEARLIGLLPDVASSGPPTGAGLGTLALIDWGQVWLAGPSLAIVVAVNVIAFFLNTSGAELAMRSDIDMDRELRQSGLANSLLGLVGGITSFVSTGTTIIAHKLEATGRALTLAYCAVVLLGGIFAAQVAAAVPVFVAGGLLLFIGLSMILPQ